MKHGIVKMWVCKECAREFLDKPLICSKCDTFEFDVKYGGQITDAEELAKLIESYRSDDIRKYEELQKIEAARKKEESQKAKENSKKDETNKNKRSSI